ncbi:Transcription factor [Penicillium freii]|nr:Transcription factor [Penicillium freii]
MELLGGLTLYSAAGGGLFASHGETDDDDKPNSFHGPEIESLLEKIGDLLQKSRVFPRHRHLKTGRPSKFLGAASLDFRPPPPPPRAGRHYGRSLLYLFRDFDFMQMLMIILSPGYLQNSIEVSQ